MLDLPEYDRLLEDAEASDDEGEEEEGGGKRAKSHAGASPSRGGATLAREQLQAVHVSLAAVVSGLPGEGRGFGEGCLCEA
jgi:hypothetical protein